MREQLVGVGFDAHAFGGEGPIVLGGVSIENDVGLVGTSDADVATHAICDAILGAASLGDLGEHFPSFDPQWEDADSLAIARRCVAMIQDRGYELVNVDVTIVAESVRVGPHREAMRNALANALMCPLLKVSVKATSTDGLGWVGRGEGISAIAVASIQG